MLPKVNPPQLHNVVRRERLFALLASCDKPLIWVHGSPGEGKTSLVADFLVAQQLNAAWLNIDEDDRNPGSFFHYLALAVTVALPQRQLSLPLFEGEYQKNVIAFARLFFRSLATQIDGPLHLIIDNIQIAADDTMYQIIKVASQELPATIKLVVISREAPPAALVRLIANQQIGLIGTQQLRFTVEEATQLLAGYSIDPDMLQAMYTRTEGWAAGLVFWRELSREPNFATPGDVVASRNALFAYFANESFSRAEPALQKLLLCTAHLPHIPATVAVVLSGNQSAIAWLNDLCARNLFTYRVMNNPPTFQYHRLFREFLLDQAEKILTSEDKRNLLRQTVDSLYDSGYVEEAITTCLAMEAYADAARLILEQATELCRHGRHRTLSNWLNQLPDELYTAQPWLAFWKGEAHLVFDDVPARAALEQAYRGFVEQGDTNGQLLTAATILEAIQWGETTYRDVELWAKIVKKLYSVTRSNLAPSDELRIASGRLLADILLGRVDSELPAISERILNLLMHHLSDPNRCVDAATRLMAYYFIITERQAVHKLVAIVEPFLSSVNLSIGKRAMWQAIYAYYLAFRTTMQQQAIATWREAIELSEQAQLLRPLVASKIFYAELLLSQDDLDGASRLLQDIAEKITELRGLYRIIYHHNQARIALLRDDYKTSVHHAQTALAQCDLIDFPKVLRDTYTMNLLRVYAVTGEYDKAEFIIADIGDRSGQNPQIDCVFTTLRSLVALGQGKREDGLAFLKRALGVMRERNYNVLPRLPRAVTRTLCEAALEEGIETEYVLKYAAPRKLLLPMPDWKHWPWKIKLYCLGKFVIVVGDQTLESNSHKALELLRCLLTLGGREVSTDALIRILWPGEGRMGTKNTFDSALHRLRKLLGGDDAVLLKEHQVSLNPEKIWIDAWALQATLDRVAVIDYQAKHVQLSMAADQVFDLYRGHIHADAPRHPELLAAGEQLWGRVRQFLLRTAQSCESCGDVERAEQAYRFGMQRDPLAAEFSFGLMQLLIRANRQAEALHIYTSFARVSRAILGQEPGVELQALARRL